VRRGASGLVLRGVEKVAAKAVDAGGAMGATGIVGTVRRRLLVRKRRWKRLGVLLQAVMLRLMTRCWMLRRVRMEMRKRLVRAHPVRMDSAGGVGVADGGGDAELRVRLRRRRRAGMRQMSLV
jgi:hypothetical protein